MNVDVEISCARAWNGSPKKSLSPAAWLTGPPGSAIGEWLSVPPRGQARPQSPQPS